MKINPIFPKNSITIPKIRIKSENEKLIILTAFLTELQFIKIDKNAASISPPSRLIIGNKLNPAITIFIRIM